MVMGASNCMNMRAYTPGANADVRSCAGRETVGTVTINVCVAGATGWTGRAIA
jgi:hypothetical protein